MFEHFQALSADFSLVFIFVATPLQNTCGAILCAQLRPASRPKGILPKNLDSRILSGGHIFITNSITKMAKGVQVHFQNWDLVGLGAWARSMCQPHWPHKDTLEDWPLTRTHPPQDLPQRAHLRLWLGRFGAAADATASSPPHKTSRRPAHTPHFKSVLCNSEILNRRSTRFVVFAPLTHKV